MRVLVTGGAGFIGSHLCEALLCRGHELTILDNFNDFYDPAIKERNVRQVAASGEFELCRADLLDEAALDRLFQSRLPEAVIHLAAYAGVRPSLENPSLYDRVNVTGTINLLERSRTYGVKNFIFGSSSSVYGVNSKVPFSETDPLERPVSPYAVTKRAGELLCYSYHHNYGLSTTCLRFFTVYGPRQRPEMAIHKFTRMLFRRETIPVFHQGQSERDYTYVMDIVEGILAALGHRFDFEIFNLGNSRTVRLLDLIGALEEATGIQARIELKPAQPGDVPITSADITKAREVLGFDPGMGIEAGIRDFVDWYRRTNPEC
jgi:UDP-glucuronate 4-epimerase